MKNLIIGAMLALVLCLASCGGSQQIEMENNSKVSAAATQEWVSAWNASATAFRFNSIGSWDKNKSFGSLYNGNNFPADAYGFTNAIAHSMHRPTLAAPTSGSILGIWYDGIDDLE